MSAIGALLALVAACGEKDSDSIPDTLVDDSATESLPDDSSPVDDSSPNDDTGIPCPYDSYAEIQPIVDQDQDGYLSLLAIDSCVIDRIIAGDFADAPEHLPDLLRHWRDGELTDDQVFDWDDNDRTVYPGAPEQCDDVDDDQDGVVDESPDPTHEDTLTFYDDTDNDGYGDPENPIVACTIPDMASENADDCDPSQTTVNPGAEEVCEDGIDNDCDGGPNDCSWTGTFALGSSDAVIDTDMTGAFFAKGVFSIGDIDGSGSERMAIPYFQSETIGIEIHNGATDHPLYQSPYVLTDSGPGTIADVSIAPAGDLNGDGVNDFWVYPIYALDFDESNSSEENLPYAEGVVSLISGVDIVAAASDSSISSLAVYQIDVQIQGGLPYEQEEYSGDVMAFDIDSSSPGVMFSAETEIEGNAAYLFFDPTTQTSWDMSEADVIFQSSSSTVREFVASSFDNGDINGDGSVDLLIASPRYGVTDTDLFGKIGIFSATSNLSGTVNLDTADWSVVGNSNDELGNDALLDDLNQDGYDDVIVSASAYDNAMGRVDFYYTDVNGNLDGSLDVSIVYSSSLGPFAQVGRDLDAVLLNENDAPDLVVGTFGENNLITGSAFVFYDIGTESTGTFTTDDADLTIVNENPGDGVGMYNTGILNPTGNGLNGLLIGAYAYNNDNGRAYLNLWDNSLYQ